MEKVTLISVCQSYRGTFGVLVHNFQPLCVTLELPWADNQNDISCIPAGSYPAKKFHSPTKGDVLLLSGVPGRTNVEIHAGNTMADTHGCILVGRGYAFDGSIFSSQDALKYVLSQLPDECLVEVVR